MYKLTNNQNMIKQDNLIFIPVDLSNTNYLLYLKWLDNGGVPEPADIPLDNIPSISPRQIRMALTRTGLRSAVESAVINSNDNDLKDWWEFSTTFDRLNPQVILMGESLGQTSEQLDSLWQLGFSL
jgi:hypothetical protein